MNKKLLLILIALSIPLIAQASIFDNIQKWFNYSEPTVGATVLYPSGGGLGTSTSPKAGQIPIGTSGGIYNPAFLTAGTDITITTSSAGILITFASSTNLNLSYLWATSTAAKIGTLTNTKWCSTDGNQIICTQEPPSGGGGGEWSTSTDLIYINAGTEVLIGASATTTGGYVFEVVGSSIFDNVNIGGTLTYASSTNWDKGYVGYVIVNASSSKWDSTYSIVNASSSKWDATYSIVNASSSKWDLTYSLVNASSSKWDEAYGWGDHSSVGYLDSSNKYWLTNGTTLYASDTFSAIVIGATAPDASNSDAQMFIYSSIDEPSLHLKSTKDGNKPQVYVEGPYASSTKAFQVGVTGEGYARLSIANNGRIGWSDGTADRDTFLMRSSANNLLLSSTRDGTGAANFTAVGFIAGSNITVSSTTNWNVAYGKVNSSSSNWDKGYAGYVIVNASSSKWDAAYGSVANNLKLTALGGLATTTGNLIIGAGGNNGWSALGSGAAGQALYGNGAGVAPSWQPPSSTSISGGQANYPAIWSSATALTTGTIGNAYIASSTNWNSAYDWYLASSTAINAGITYLNASSSKWNITYSIVNASSSKWDSTYSIVNASSSKWDSTYSIVNASSTNWDKAYSWATTSLTYLNASSTNWNNSYNWYNASSATHNTWVSWLAATSSNLNAAYNWYNSSSTAHNAAVTLSVASSTNWSKAYGSASINANLMQIGAFATTTGNLMMASGTTGWSLLEIGTSGKFLRASSSAPGGIAWETMPSTSLSGGQANYLAWWNGATTISTSTTITPTFPGLTLTGFTGALKASSGVFATSSTLVTRTASINFLGVTTTATYARGSFRVPSAATIVEVGCYTDSGTTTIAFYEAGEATPNASSSSILNSIICDNNQATSTTFADSSIAVRGFVAALIMAVSGATNTVAWVNYTITP